MFYKRKKWQKIVNVVLVAMKLWKNVLTRNANVVYRIIWVLLEKIDNDPEIMFLLGSNVFCQ